MIIVHGQFRVSDARELVRHRKLLEDHVQTVRSQAGCLDYILSVDLFDPCMVSVSLKWEHEAAIKASYESRDVLASLQTLEEIGVVGRAISTYEVTQENTPKALPGNVFAFAI